MPEHGTVNRYSAGCRCAGCRDASTDYHRHQRRRRAARIPPDAQHGVWSTYKNWGCRCTPCTQANTDSLREWRRGKAQEFWRQKQAADG